jgi:hypothetical protein
MLRKVILFLKRYALKAIQMKLMYGSKELELLQQLKSPFIVGYEDSFPSGFSYCIILEYCEVFRKLTRVNAQSNINLRNSDISCR